MQKIKFENEKAIKNYSKDVEALKKLNPNLTGVSIDISLNIDLGLIFIGIEERKIAVTSEQAIDLIKVLREAVNKINPKLLQSNRHGR